MAEKFVETRIMTTRDGEKLFTVIIKPRPEGRFPVLLERCPYSMTYSETLTAENFYQLEPYLLATFDHEALFDAGYCFVYQHVRGTGNSTGGQVYYGKYEYFDGIDTMEWLRQQDFYNGEIFRFGASYTGMSCMVDACEHYPDLKGLVCLVPGPAPAQIGIRNGFIKQSLGVTFSTYMASIRQPSPDFHYTMDSFRTFPQKLQRDLIFGEGNVNAEMFRDFQEHQDGRDPFWISEDGPCKLLYRSYQELDVPTLFASAWFCPLIGDMTRLWDQTLSESARRQSALFIGPYDHNVLHTRETWKFDMEGAETTVAFPNYVVNWLNHLRTGEPLVRLQKGKVQFFPECGQKKWYAEDTFTDGEVMKTLYLNSDRSLGETAIDGEITYLYNPQNPAIFYEGCGNTNGFARPTVSAYPVTSDPLSPQDNPNFRYDVISFLSQPFAEQAFLKGRFCVDLNVKSDCEDTCFYARLDIIKDGVPYAVRDDITSLCYQLGDYQPGTEVSIHFEFPALCWNIQPGDQLRLDISSSSFPNYSVHTNVKGRQSDVVTPKVAHNTIVCGRSRFTFHTSALSPADYVITTVEEGAPA